MARGSNRVYCLTCGLDLKNRRCFDVKIEDVDDTRNVDGVCLGCSQAYCCGKIQLPSCSESSINSENITNSSGVFDATFDESAICAVSTPLNKSKASPVPYSRITSLQNQAKRSRKRRGSALERLLKEEDSETDRSLSGFLNMVSKH